jgi:hypothetical protein
MRAQRLIEIRRPWVVARPASTTCAHSWVYLPESAVEIAVERLLDQRVKGGGSQFGRLLQPFRTLKSLEGSSRVVAKEPVDSTGIVPCSRS